ncbi:hypothetical protein Tco_1217107 [Tanacetum coccineum]
MVIRYLLHHQSPLSPYLSPLLRYPSPLPIPSPPPKPTYIEGSLGSRAAGIRQRDALPSPVHETEMPEMCLPLRKRPCRTYSLDPDTSQSVCMDLAELRTCRRVINADGEGLLYHTDATSSESQRDYATTLSYG